METLHGKIPRLDERRPGHPVTPSPCLQIMEHAQRMRLVGRQIDEKARAFKSASTASHNLNSQRDVGKHRRQSMDTGVLDPWDLRSPHRAGRPE